MRIFVSYSHKDAAVADKLSAALKRAGHDLWKWDESLRPGDNLAKKTREGIAEADAFLLLVSANALASQAVLQEFSTLALSEVSRNDLRIVPVLIDGSPVPGYLAEYLWLDIAADVDAGIAMLVASLDRPFESREAHHQLRHPHRVGQARAL